MASHKISDLGYEYSFVKEPPDTTICVICQLPSRDPYLSLCCGHVFCKSCLDAAKKVAVVVTANCPMCRSEDFATVPNKQIDRVVRSLHVYCTNKEKGCEWQGEVNYIGNHLGRSDGCHFEDVQCSNKCGEMVQRQYLVSHMEAECPRRMVTCQYCGVADEEYQLIEGDHKELCPKFPLPCPNKCDVGSVPRQDMTEHRKMCPLEEVECSNKCGKILQRQYLDNHLETKCPRRIVNCQYCQLTGEHQFIEGRHKEQCPKFPVPCPNNCDIGLKVSREDMDAHRKECPLETVQCQYQCVGCDDVMVRKYQREHNKENMEEHLALAVSELINSRQHLEQRLLQKLTRTEQDLAISKKDMVSVKDQMTQKLTKTEHDLMIVKQTAAKIEDALRQTLTRTENELTIVKEELATTKQRSSIVYAEFFASEIKHKLPSISDELTMTLANFTNNVDQKCQDVVEAKRRNAEQVNIATFGIEGVAERYCRTVCRKGPLRQADAVKQDIERDQEQLLQNIEQAEGKLPAIHQQLDDVELHITKSIDELILQLDVLMKELTMYGKNNVVAMLNTVKTDTLKSKDEMMKRLTQKREDVTNAKKKLETAKDDILTNTNDLLKQLSDKAQQRRRY